jgi:hypothetical protein
LGDARPWFRRAPADDEVRELPRGDAGDTDEGVLTERIEVNGVATNNGSKSFRHLDRMPRRGATGVLRR